jgi:uncharacterized protein YqgQ
LDLLIAQTLCQLQGERECMVVVGIAVKGLDTQNERMSRRCDQADLAAELLLFVDLAFADALYIRRMNRIVFGRIMPLLRENVFHPVQQILKEYGECRLFQKFSLEITDYSASSSFQTEVFIRAYEIIHNRENYLLIKSPNFFRLWVWRKMGIVMFF